MLAGSRGWSRQGGERHFGGEVHPIFLMTSVPEAAMVWPLMINRRGRHQPDLFVAMPNEQARPARS